MKNSRAFSAQDRIGHTVYGLGTIVAANERHTTILFGEAGAKKFITSVVQLVPSDTPAPARRTRRKKTAVRSK